MYATLLIVLMVPFSTLSDGNFADNILKKQEECDTIKTKVGKVVLDEGGDEFPGIPEEYYDQCDDDLSTLKLEYLNKFQLSSSLYPEVFPALLSNLTLVLLPSSPKTELSTIPIIHPCPSCESLCFLFEKCASLLDQINQNVQPSEHINKMKYAQCLESLTAQKIKFIHDHNISKEFLKGARFISLSCKKRPVLITLLKLEKLYFESTLTAHGLEKSDKEAQAAPRDSLNQIHPGDSHEADSIVLKTISNKDGKESGKKIISDLKMSNINNDLNGQIEYSSAKRSNSVHHDLPSMDTFKDSQGDHGDISKHNDDVGGISNLRHAVVGSKYTSDDEKGGAITLVEIQADKENMINNEPASTSDLDQGKKEFGDFGQRAIITATPIPETLGDEIFEKEIDCEEILKMANGVLEYHSFDSVRYYDDQYTECKQSLHKIKNEYADRHGIVFENYKSVFPVVLSNGVERLVSLPWKISGNYQRPNPDQTTKATTHSSSGDVTRQLAREETLEAFIDGGRNKIYGGVDKINRISMNNPAFISNDEFYEYFSKNSQVDGQTTLSRFTKLIRKNTGHSDRTDE